MTSRFGGRALLARSAIARRARFPAPSIEVGRADGVALARRHRPADLRRRLGRRSIADTIFDLASLTKVHRDDHAGDARRRRGRLGSTIAVSALAPRMERRRSRGRHDPRSARARVRAHRVPAFYPRLHRPLSSSEHAICTLPLEYAPRSQSIYSDLGFMLLGFILEDAQPPGAGFRGAPATIDPSRRLATQFHRLASFFTAEPLRFNPPRAWRDRTAPTELDRVARPPARRRGPRREHWALGGAAGHAGLFGTAAAVGAFARAVLRTIAGEPIARRARNDARVHRADATSRTARARSAGTRCCRPRRAARAVARRRSATPASPGRRCGSTGSGISTSCLLTNRVHPDARPTKPSGRCARGSTTPSSLN